MLALLALACLAAGVSAECPNACSGQGDCGTKDSCTCYDGFFGGDCSLRVCPVGKAFVDTPAGDLNHNGLTGQEYAISQKNKRAYQAYESWPSSAAAGGWEAQAGESHFLVECSAKGACDRTMGVCQCFDGYTGASCQRTTCPNSCSGHGVCSTVGVLASGGAKTFVGSTYGQVTYSGVVTPQAYRLWDDDKNSACRCDPGYSGIDCSLRLCPVGDDPLTWDASSCGGSACVSEVQSFSVDGAQAAGKYSLVFTNFDGAAYTTAPFTLDTRGTLAANAAAQLAVQAALHGVPNNVTGTVIVQASGGGLFSYQQLRVKVTFSTRSGNLPAMALQAQAGAGRSYLFQPSQPVQTLSFPGLASGNAYVAQYKIFPTDTSLFPSVDGDAYWTSAVSSAFVYQGDPAGILAAVTAIASALNSIPVITYAYPGFFVADANVVGVLDIPTLTFKVNVAFPDFLTGSIALSTKVVASASSSTISTASWQGVATSYVALLSDNVNGNREAVTCSNRGICDFATGLCSCFAGQTGEDCSQQNALAHGGSSSGSSGSK